MLRKTVPDPYSGDWKIDINRIDIKTVHLSR